jgi:hypothetical protein
MPNTRKGEFVWFGYFVWFAVETSGPVGVAGRGIELVAGSAVGAKYL